jgi:hypothetical protein
MTEYNLEACVRQYNGVSGGGPYLDEAQPTLVTADQLANVLGFDTTFGPEFVKKTFTTVDGTAPAVDVPVELTALGTLEAAAVDNPAALDAIAVIYKEMGYEKAEKPVQEETLDVDAEAAKSAAKSKAGK